MRTTRWSRRGARLLVGAVLAVLAGCSPHAPAPPGTGDRPEPGGKPLPPLEVGLDLQPGRLGVGTEVPFTLRVVWQREASRARVSVQAAGVVALHRRPDPTPRHAGERDRWSVAGSVRLQRQGEGELRGTAEALDAAGQVLYGRSATLYVLVHGGEVLTGTVSPSDLRLRAARMDLDAGRISPREYERLREDILGGGAETS
jgi:hypothetical protein